MTTITKTIDIPADRILKLEVDLPDSLPPGKAELSLSITPESVPQDKSLFLSFCGFLKDSDTFSGDPVEIQRKMRDE
ncbi:MAG: hypothetical protein LBS60_09470 [Deltaproteobacteria bacterium]|jgi:hypothetical protein|nr:hypothetical protein [Deltaproteobacteria bacterium]